jgi:hypothetical protein
VIPDRVIDRQPHEPAEQQVELQPLHQQALGADRVKRLEEHRSQQHLGRDRWPTRARVKLVERPCQGLQRGIRKLTDRSQGVIAPNPNLEVNIRKQ